MDTWRLYKVTNTVNGKSYIGYTKNPLAWRWKRHCEGCWRNSLIYHAIRKYGKNTFVVEELCQVSSKQDAWARERELIVSHGTFMPSGYNMTFGGDGNDAPRSKETRERMRQAQRRRDHSHSAETRAKISAANKGRKRPQSATDSQRAKMIGQKRSAEMRAKMRQIGLAQSPEKLAKIIQSRRENLRNKREREGQLNLEI